MHQCMKLKPDFVGLEALAGKPCPFEGVSAFLDVLLGRSAPVGPVRVRGLEHW